MAADKKVILCTGGGGYIGAHTAIQLVGTGRYECIIVDNLVNSCPEAVEVITKLGNGAITFKNIDLVSGREELNKLKFDGVIHFAALKAVGESVERPLDYFYNNLNSLLTVLYAMKDVGCKNLVFSSSATVYQPSEKLLTEDSPIGASNPYGQTKVMCEQILKDLFVSDDSWHLSLLRYFNPVGCHPSGEIGESPEVPMNILPIIQQAAVGKRECVTIAGEDWPTPDGTGVRDYIHVMDLADGHILALDKLLGMTKGELMIHNLGTGRGYSVKEMIAAFEKACGKKIPVKIGPRRAGDLATVVASPEKAAKDLGFKATRSIAEACESAWKWQSSHPDGFRTKKH